MLTAGGLSFPGRSSTMKQVTISIPTKTMIHAGILPERFFQHNAKLEVLRVFAVAERTAVLIADVQRKSDLYTPREIDAMRDELSTRYNLEHFELIELDEPSRTYTVLLRARVPDVLEEAWRTVGNDAFLDGPLIVTPESITLSFVTLGHGEKPIRLLRDFQVPYTVKEVRKGALGGSDNGLTREQRALLRMAFELGYYEVPARVNLTQLARYSGVSKAAMSKKLRRAERKLLVDWVRAGR